MKKDPSVEVDLSSDLNEKEPTMLCYEGRAFHADGTACAKALRWERHLYFLKAERRPV